MPDNDETTERPDFSGMRFEFEFVERVAPGAFAETRIAAAAGVTPVIVGLSEVGPVVFPVAPPPPTGGAK